MNWQQWVDPIFPVIEPLSKNDIKAQRKQFDSDIEGIRNAKFDLNDERALNEAQRVADAEIERVRTAESKATTYLAVLAALVPLVITLQVATWEAKSGPAPESVKLGVLALATVYVAAAGFHAFRTLQVSGFQRVGEGEIVTAWRSRRPLQRLARGTLLASLRSRDAVNAKITRIRVTHQHLVRAFGAFILLLLLDPIFYGLGFRNEEPQSEIAPIVPQSQERQAKSEMSGVPNKSAPNAKHDANTAANLLRGEGSRQKEQAK